MGVLERFLDCVIEIYILARDEGVRSVRFVSHNQGKRNVGRGDVKEVLNRVSSTRMGFSRVDVELHRKIIVPFVLGAKEKPAVIKRPILVMIVGHGSLVKSPEFFQCFPLILNRAESFIG